jgi:hypothetical protein
MAPSAHHFLGVDRRDLAGNVKRPAPKPVTVRRRPTRCSSCQRWCGAYPVHGIRLGSCCLKKFRGTAA